MVIVFGNRAYDDTLLEMKNEATACGFEVGAAIVAVAEHSIVHQFGKARPDVKDKDELQGYANGIKELIANRKSPKDFKVQGNQPYKEYGGVPMKPKANKSCTRCGLCAAKCPTGAIPAENPASLDQSKCISCMRCVAVCPEHARQLNKAVLFVASQAMKKACSSRKENEMYL